MPISGDPVTMSLQSDEALVRAFEEIEKLTDADLDIDKDKAFTTRPWNQTRTVLPFRF